MQDIKHNIIKFAKADTRHPLIKFIDIAHKIESEHISETNKRNRKDKLMFQSVLVMNALSLFSFIYSFIDLAHSANLKINSWFGGYIIFGYFIFSMMAWNLSSLKGRLAYIKICTDYICHMKKYNALVDAVNDMQDFKK